MFECVLVVENEYRANECPGYDSLDCECTFDKPKPCVMTWNCIDVMENV
jgi:hypothetical protein